MNGVIDCCIYIYTRLLWALPITTYGSALFYNLHIIIMQCEIITFQHLVSVLYVPFQSKVWIKLSLITVTTELCQPSTTHLGD